jgi:dTDP-4-dehydrorhamnose 3,5-epimerase
MVCSPPLVIHRTSARRRTAVTRRIAAAPHSKRAGYIRGCVRDEPSVHSDWSPARTPIEGVVVREVRNVPRRQGLLTEIYRKDWGLDGGLEQVFQVVLAPGQVSAWHVHFNTLDRLFVASGMLEVVLFDARRRSPTFGRINEFRFGVYRPALVTVPPGVWHGLQNAGRRPASVLNLVDRAYLYDAPDHWRLPWNTRRIPYRFGVGPQTRRC